MLQPLSRTVAPGPTSMPASAVQPAVPLRTLSADALRVSAAGLAMAPVTRKGGDLQLNGKPFTFVGINCYDLIGIGQRSQKDLEQTLRTIAASGATVVRFGAYAGKKPEDLARILDTSNRLGLGLRFIPILSNQWANMETGGEAKRKDAAWFAGGYKTTYLPHVRTMVQALGDRPEILMWEQINEPATTDVSALKQFTKDVAHEIKANGGRLVAISNIGSVGVGLLPSYYLPMATSPDVDVISLHDYAANYGHRPITQAALGLLGRGMVSAEALTARMVNKPFFIGEVGTRITTSGPDKTVVSTPAGSMAGNLAKGKHAIEHGAAGVLLWGPAPDGRSVDGHGYNMPFKTTDANGSLLKRTLGKLHAAFPKP